MDNNGKTLKSTELRIGNWIANEQGIPYRVMPLDIVHLNQIEQAGKQSIDHNPIKLTGKWLRDLGFDFNEINGVYSKSGIELYWLITKRKPQTLEFEDYLFVHEIAKNYSSITTHIEYVHQIQNLFFSMLNEELTF